MRLQLKATWIIIAVIAVLGWSPVTGLSQIVPKPIRLRLPPGNNTAVAKGLVGGEATDSYLIHAKAGQKLAVRALSQFKRTQVYVSLFETDLYLTDREKMRSDLTRWQGTLRRTGDYLIQVNVYPGGEYYTLRVTVMQ